MFGFAPCDNKYLTNFSFPNATATINKDGLRVQALFNTYLILIKKNTYHLTEIINLKYNCIYI